MNELTFWKRFEEHLSECTGFELVYISAELRPFTDQMRPDALIKPCKGSFNGQTIFVELKLTSKPLGEKESYKFLSTNKKWAEEALGRLFYRYIYASSEHVSEYVAKRLEKEGIYIASDIITPQQLVDYLRDLSVEL